MYNRSGAGKWYTVTGLSGSRTSGSAGAVQEAKNRTQNNAKTPIFIMGIPFKPYAAKHTDREFTPGTGPRSSRGMSCRPVLSAKHPKFKNAAAERRKTATAKKKSLEEVT
jgi:hypothetical protein